MCRPDKHFIILLSTRRSKLCDGLGWKRSGSSVGVGCLCPARGQVGAITIFHEPFGSVRFVRCSFLFLAGSSSFHTHTSSSAIIYRVGPFTGTSMSSWPPYPLPLHHYVRVISQHNNKHGSDQLPFWAHEGVREEAGFQHPTRRGMLSAPSVVSRLNGPDQNWMDQLRLGEIW